MKLDNLLSLYVYGPDPKTTTYTLFHHFGPLLDDSFNAGLRADIVTFFKKEEPGAHPLSLEVRLQQDGSGLATITYRHNVYDRGGRVANAANILIANTKLLELPGVSQMQLLMLARQADLANMIRTFSIESLLQTGGTELAQCAKSKHDASWAASIAGDLERDLNLFACSPQDQRDKTLQIIAASFSMLPQPCIKPYDEFFDAAHGSQIHIGPPQSGFFAAGPKQINMAEGIGYVKNEFYLAVAKAIAAQIFTPHAAQALHMCHELSSAAGVGRAKFMEFINKYDSVHSDVNKTMEEAIRRQTLSDNPNKSIIIYHKLLKTFGYEQIRNLTNTGAAANRLYEAIMHAMKEKLFSLKYWETLALCHALLPLGKQNLINFIYNYGKRDDVFDAWMKHAINSKIISDDVDRSIETYHRLADAFGHEQVIQFIGNQESIKKSAHDMIKEFEKRLHFRDTGRLAELCSELRVVFGEQRLRNFIESYDNIGWEFCNALRQSAREKQPACVDSQTDEVHLANFELAYKMSLFFGERPFCDFIGKYRERKEVYVLAKTNAVKKKVFSSDIKKTFSLCDMLSMSFGRQPVVDFINNYVPEDSGQYGTVGGFGRRLFPSDVQKQREIFSTYHNMLNFFGKENLLNVLRNYGRANVFYDTMVAAISNKTFSDDAGKSVETYHLLADVLGSQETINFVATIDNIKNDTYDFVSAYATAAGLASQDLQKAFDLYYKMCAFFSEDIAYNTMQMR